MLLALAAVVHAFTRAGSTTVAGMELHVGSCTRCTYSDIHAARDTVRRFRSSGHGGEVRVVVHEGRYPALMLDPELDSGSAGSGTVYVGHNQGGEAVPIISAGVEVPKAAWTPAVGQYAEGVLVADLAKLGFTQTDLGHLPINGNARAPHGTEPNQTAVWWGTVCEQRNTSTGHKAMLSHQSAVGVVGAHLARFPNIDGATGHWKFLHGVGPGHTNGSKGDADGLVLNANDTTRVLRWVAKEEAAYLHGYWIADWEDATVLINASDLSANSVYWAAGTAGPQPGHNPRYLGIY